jgi:hypothetical protein
MTGTEGRMRRLGLLGLLIVTAACHRAGDVSGLYADAFTKPSWEGAGTFIPCDQPKALWRASDSALTAAYRRTATRPYELVFVRLRGVQADSGSVYGGAHHILVHNVLELRTRRPGDCPAVPDSVARVIGGGDGPS